MYTTKFEDRPVDIDMEVSLQKSLAEQGVNPVEIFRLIESFVDKLLVTKAAGEVRLENADTAATIDLDITWVEGAAIKLQVVDVNLNKAINEKPRSGAKDAKFNFATPPEEIAASEGQPTQH